MISMDFSKFFADLLDIVFPPLCLNCKERFVRKNADPICNRCQSSIEISNGFYCPECKRRLPEPNKSCHPNVKFVLAAASDYENGVVRELIRVLKYRKLKSALKPLAGVIEKYARQTFENCKLRIENFVIIPLPLHPGKERERGFNQAYLVAEALRQCLEVRPPQGSTSPLEISKCRYVVGEVESRKIGIETDNLVRVKNTKSQTEISDYEKRKENITGCFRVKFPERIKGRSILLVDDVFTSGATMKEAVRALKTAGAGKIIGFVIAKA